MSVHQYRRRRRCRVTSWSDAGIPTRWSALVVEWLPAEILTLGEADPNTGRQQHLEVSLLRGHRVVVAGLGLQPVESGLHQRNYPGPLWCETTSTS